MTSIQRRDFLGRASIAAAGFALPSTPQWVLGNLTSDVASSDRLAISTFRVDVTPPNGHSLCGGWIPPVASVADELEAIGVVLQGDFDPIVLCSVDWTGILNQTHVDFRRQIAAAVGSTPDRVALHCVHQHNAPFACLEAQALVADFDDLPAIVDREFIIDCRDRLATAAQASLASAVPVTRLLTGQANVDRIASNRRFIDENGQIEFWRGSSCRDERLRSLPEGLIDSKLQSIIFAGEDRTICALHYYATHPMSYYGDGIVTSDFAGLARKRLQEQDDCCHLYFTGCAGNIAAGKYNDGSQLARQQLTDRLHEAMRQSYENAQEVERAPIQWRTHELVPIPRATLDEQALLAQISNSSLPVRDRNRPAFQLAWLRRISRQEPIVLSSLHLGGAIIGHLPAESFIEYQLSAQSFAPRANVATAAYGDGGPWYLPTSDAYAEGGYEVSVAFCEPNVDTLMQTGLRELIQP